MCCTSLNINKDDIARLSNDQLPASIQQQLSTVKSRIEAEAAIARRNQLLKNRIRLLPRHFSR
jgi:hypothetical protein